MAIGAKDVKHVAKLARLGLSEEEITTYTKQLNDILEHMDKLNALNTENIDPLTHAIPGHLNVMRPDGVRDGLSREAALSNAPQSNERYFKVSRMVGEGEK